MKKYNKKGLFIVLDGTDGSGKATQTGLLIKRLKKEGHRVEKIDFPQYGKKFAVLVEEYLNGMFGTAEEVGPYRASIFYACDRYAASGKIKKWLSEGKIVVCDRYVTANMGHQGGKIKNISERNKYFKWLYDLEYNIFGIPKPDVNIILHVNAAYAQKMVDPDEKRSYIKKGKRDIHENDLGHLQSAEKVFLEIAKKFPDFHLIECMRNGSIMKKEEISGLIWDKLK
jgi:dTMP kinase